MKFSRTQKGNRVLLDGGYEYTQYRKNCKNVITWRCRAYFATKCRAFLKTFEDNIIGESPQHCHDSNPQKAQAAALMATMKQDMKGVGATPRNVIGNVLSRANMDVIEHLPKTSSLTRTLFNHKMVDHIPNPFLF